MLYINVGKYTRPEDESVRVIAHGWGLYGAKHEHDHVKYEMNYASGFSVEELISSASVELGIEFYKQYGEPCYMSSIHILNEHDYEDYIIGLEEQKKEYADYLK